VTDFLNNFPISNVHTTENATGNFAFDDGQANMRPQPIKTFCFCKSRMQNITSNSTLFSAAQSSTGSSLESRRQDNDRNESTPLVLLQGQHGKLTYCGHTHEEDDDKNQTAMTMAPSQRRTWYGRVVSDRLIMSTHPFCGGGCTALMRPLLLERRGEKFLREPSSSPPAESTVQSELTSGLSQ
jgi:hypothetical protein